MAESSDSGMDRRQALLRLLGLAGLVERSPPAGGSAIAVNVLRMNWSSTPNAVTPSLHRPTSRN